MSLSGEDRRYFRNLVILEQSSDESAKKEAFQKLRTIAGEENVDVLDSNQYDYYEQWYNGVLRELLTQRNDHDDHEALGKALQPAVSASKVRNSLEVLERNNLIIRNERGLYEQTHRRISTGNEVVSLAVRELHRQMADLGKQSIDTVSREQRDISGLTIGVSAEGVDRIRAEIEAFRRKIAGIVAEDKEEDRVYRLNLQLFPLTKLPKEGNHG
jgi:uncharacterized protein (TIGR02147 family)